MNPHSADNVLHLAGFEDRPLAGSQRKSHVSEPLVIHSYRQRRAVDPGRHGVVRILRPCGLRSNCWEWLLLVVAGMLSPSIRRWWWRSVRANSAGSAYDVSDPAAPRELGSLAADRRRDAAVSGQVVVLVPAHNEKDGIA